MLQQVLHGTRCTLKKSHNINLSLAPPAKFSSLTSLEPNRKCALDSGFDGETANEERGFMTERMHGSKGKISRE